MLDQGHFCKQINYVPRLRFMIGKPFPSVGMQSRHAKYLFRIRLNAKWSDCAVGNFPPTSTISLGFHLVTSEISNLMARGGRGAEKSWSRRNRFRRWDSVGETTEQNEHGKRQLQVPRLRMLHLRPLEHVSHLDGWTILGLV